MLPESTPSSPGSKFYRPEIDGLRALAILAVVLNHTDSGLLPSGYLGVDIFFVISGYVITASLFNRSNGSLRAFLLEFYSRRVKRLVPALILCVGLTGVLICLFSADPQISLRTGIWSLAGLSNLYLLAQATNYFAATSDLNVFAQTWSLGVEEQFYILYPTLIWCVIRVGGRSRGRLLSMALVALLSTASLALYLKLSAVNHSAAYFMTLSRFWELGVGCCLFALPRFQEQARAWYLSPTIPLVGLCIALFSPLAWQAAATIACVVCSALLILALGPATTAYRVFTLRPVLYLGVISYSLYLWHWSVLSLSHWTVGVTLWTFPLQLLLMVGLAAASYAYVERPLRHSSWRWSGSGAITWGGLALVGCAGVLTILDGPVGRHLYLGASAGNDGELVFQNGTATESSSCIDPVEITQSVVSECTSPSTRSASQTLYFMGDSHTVHLKAMAERLVENDDVTTQMLSVPGTPSPPLIYSIERRRSPLVDQFRNDLQAEILRRAMETVAPGDLYILSNRLSYYFVDRQISAIEEDYQFAYYRSPSRIDRVSRTEALELWIEDIEELADALTVRGADVIVLLPLPEFRGAVDPYPIEACAPQWFRPGPSDDHCIFGQTMDRSLLQDRIADLTTQLRSAAGRHSNLHLYDPFPVICPQEPACSMVLNRTRIFEDDDHLSRQGAEMLYPDFRTFLVERGLLANWLSGGTPETAVDAGFRPHSR